jgi:LysM repeat protein
MAPGKMNLPKIKKRLSLIEYRANYKRWRIFLFLTTLGLIFSLWPLNGVSGLESLSYERVEGQVTPSQLIDSVNNLRIAHGLNPLAVHLILMQTAQQQADALLASDGAVGHTRPGGIDITDQLLMLGYPLAGDLSLGGYRAENFIAVRPGMTVETAIQMWLGDCPHANTMLSPYYQDIGAGIAYATDGSGFFVIDCAMPTASGKPQNASLYTNLQGSDPGVLDMSQYVQPVVLSTARPDGDVVHEVKYGQSLWSIAIAYSTRINEIQRLNNISDSTIYTGEILLVVKGATQPPPPPSETPAHTATQFPSPTLTSTKSPNPTIEFTTQVEELDQLEPVPAATSNPVWLGLVGGVIILVIIITWWVKSKDESS